MLFSQLALLQTADVSIPALPLALRQTEPEAFPGPPLPTDIGATTRRYLFILVPSDACRTEIFAPPP